MTGAALQYKLQTTQNNTKQMETSIKLRHLADMSYSNGAAITRNYYGVTECTFHDQKIYVAAHGLKTVIIAWVDKDTPICLPKIPGLQMTGIYWHSYEDFRKQKEAEEYCVPADPAVCFELCHEQRNEILMSYEDYRNRTFKLMDALYEKNEYGLETVSLARLIVRTFRPSDLRGLSKSALLSYEKALSVYYDVWQYYLIKQHEQFLSRN